MTLIFPNRLVLSAMAGITDAKFCMKHPVGLAIMGGFNADRVSMDAARKAIRRGRREFIFDDPIEGIENEVKKLVTGFEGIFAINVRSFTLDGYVQAAEIAKKYGGIIEINAHCRQPEFTEIKCGQWLLKHPDSLISIIKEIKRLDVVISVKIRGNVEGVDYSNLVKTIRQAGCHIIHVDAMIPGGGCDLKLISEISKSGFTIGNNSVVDIESAEKVINAGADMVSAARAVLNDNSFFRKLLASNILRENVELSL
jgi:TIM-barrel protein